MWTFRDRGGQLVYWSSSEVRGSPGWCAAAIRREGRGLAPAGGESVAARATQRRYPAKGSGSQLGPAGYEGRRPARGTLRARSYLAKRSRGPRPLCGGGRGSRGGNGYGTRVRRWSASFGRGVGRRRLLAQHRGINRYAGFGLEEGRYGVGRFGGPRRDRRLDSRAYWGGLDPRSQQRP